jgi:ankyrin repeat protein
VPQQADQLQDEQASVPADEPPALQCAACGNTMPGGAKFCKKCGSPAQAMEEKAPESSGAEPAVASVSADAPPALQCAACGYIMPESAKFCKKCGRPAQQRIEGEKPAAGKNSLLGGTGKDFGNNSIKDEPEADLFDAVANKQLNIVKELLAKKISLTERNGDGETVLILAADKGFLEIVELLIAKGAALDEKDKKGNTALILAAREGRLAVVELLIEKGAALDENDYYGNTALMLAAEKGYVAVVECLTAKGAVVNKKNKYGNTALMFAARFGHLEAVKYLIAKGAAIGEKNDDGNTALSLTTREGHKKVADHLIATAAAQKERKMSGDIAVKNANFCHYCKTTFQKIKAGMYFGNEMFDIGERILRMCKGCSSCGVPVCFNCAADAADRIGQRGHCICPNCGANLDSN